MSTGWNAKAPMRRVVQIINLLGNEYWLELPCFINTHFQDYKPTGK